MLLKNLKPFPSRMNLGDIATSGLSPLLLQNFDLYFPTSEWSNLQAGDNFTFPCTPIHNLINDSCFNNVYLVLTLIILMKPVQVYSKLSTM